MNRKPTHLAEPNPPLECCSIKEGKLILRVLLQPGANTDEIVGVHSDSLKIRVKAPAIEGKANQALIKLLANQFKIPKKKYHPNAWEAKQTQETCYSQC